MYIYIYIYIYLIHGKYSATLGFRKFIKQQLSGRKPQVAEYFPWIKYIYTYLIYIYLLSLLLYNSSILDIEHSSYYMALGSTHHHKVIY